MHCKGNFRKAYHQGTLMRMSPQLRAEVANEENAQWVLTVRISAFEFSESPTSPSCRADALTAFTELRSI